MKTVILFFGIIFMILAPGYISAKSELNPPDLNPAEILKTPKHNPVVLVTNGKAVAEIYYGENCGRQVKTATKELISAIKDATGADIKIVKTLTEKPTLIIGDCPEAKKAELEGTKMPIEGFEIKTAPKRIFIVGNDEVGTAWGVIDFVERFMGVRFYWPGKSGESIPTSKDLIIKPAHVKDHPYFRKRGIYPSGGSRVGRDVGPHHFRMRAYNSWPIKIIVHGPHDWSKKYGKTRPEIFQLASGGGRNFKMLCYGNQKTLETYLEEIELQLNPEVAIDRKGMIVQGKSITVSPQDMALSCKCEDCKKLWDDNGGAYGTASPIMVDFVNKLAVEVKKRWPDMTVIFLPYKNYTYAPEGAKFPGNVEVQICGMPGLAQHKDPVINKAEQDNIDAWMDASGRKIQNWHYNCWPADRTKAAYQYAHTIKKHYQDNKDKTVGSFINGVKDHWPRQNFSLYTWLKVLWNPDFDVDAAYDEYCKRMFGPAEKTMKKLISMQMDGWENRNWSSHKFSPKSVYEESFPRKDVLKMQALFAKARKEAKNDPIVTEHLDYLAPPLEEFFAESMLISEGIGVQTLKSYQVPEDPKIDGKLDDKCWKDVTGFGFVISETDGAKPRFPTELKSVWTRDGITFAFKMTEPTPKQMEAKYGAESRDGSNIWWDDNVEIFLDVTGERSEYYQFIINSKGAIFDSYVRDMSWNSKGIKAASNIDKDSWTLEVYIPYTTFDKCLEPGTANKWFGNFTRHRVIDRTDREYQRLNCNGSKSSSDQNAFGPIQFIEQ